MPLAGVTGYRTVGRKERDAFLARELTEDEKVEAAFRLRAGQNPWRNSPILSRYPPPASRRYEPGTPVIVGNLLEATVAASRNGGELVAVRHRSIERDEISRKEVARGWAYGVWHWLDVVPRPEVRPQSIVGEAISYGNQFNIDVHSLLNRAQRSLDDYPDYQRDVVWTDRERSLYMDSVFDGCELGRFIFVRSARHDEPDEVLDGKQRLNCLLAYWSSGFAHRGRYWHELDAMDQNRIEARSVQLLEVPKEDYSREQLLELFLKVNVAGIPQSTEQLDHVRALLDLERSTPVGAAPKKRSSHP